MPISMSDFGKEVTVVRITGRDAVRNHLSNLGICEGEKITLIARNNGNVIVAVKESRLALSSELANRIMI